MLLVSAVSVVRSTEVPKGVGPKTSGAREGWPRVLLLFYALNPEQLEETAHIGRATVCDNRGSLGPGSLFSQAEKDAWPRQALGQSVPGAFSAQSDQDSGSEC